MAGLMKPQDAALQGLNPAQREAVLHRGSPLLVVAGAGSGKTRVVTRRIAHLVATGTRPYSIMAVTFTNKAAGEMRERVAELLGEDAPVWVATFHSTAARILRREDGGLRRTRDFTIYDQEDSTAIVKSVLGELRLDDSEFQPRSVLGFIDGCKRDGVGPEEAPGHGYRGRKLVDAYALYEERLRAANALDFNDLLGELLRLFREAPAALDRYRRRFEHLLVDEYQDTNSVQYELVRLLAGEGGGLCAVGDPDQSIYGWRGARIENILSFEKSFPGTKIVRLEQNYRSTRPILEAAGALIEHNRARIERGLWTDKEQGRSVELFVGLDEQHEAEEIARRIGEAAAGGRSHGSFAIFYRTNAQSRAFEEVFLRNAVPYVLVSGTAFYQRAEVKDALAYLRLAVNPSDEVSFRRAVNRPPRGMGAGAQARLVSGAAARGCSLMAAARSSEVREALPPRARKCLESFVAVIDAAGGAETYPVEPVIRTILEESGLLERFAAQEETDRVENLNELAAAAGEYDFVNPDGSLAGFLEQVALVADIDRWDEKAERVSLMTLHAAKGLEFPVVFVTGLEEGLLPHFRNMGWNAEPGREDIEEERRLLYVGMTRAREELVLTLARSRRRFGPSQAASASRFIGELPAERIEPPGAVDKARQPYVQAVASDDWEWDRPKRGRGRRAGKKDRVPSVPQDPVTDEDGRYYEEAAMAAARAEELDLAVGDLV
ncbi:MAG: ATP-dependent helicase, partial [Planctomycetota bacterium]